MALTFAIPYYRHPHYLRKTLESLRRQTLRAFTVIVVDDCGPDPGAPEVVAEFADLGVKYLRNPTRLGIAGAWNRCAELVETPLFTLLHADDELEPEYAAKMTEAHARHPGSAGIYCRALVIDENSRPKFSFPDYVKRFLDKQGDEDVVLQGEDGVASLMRGCFIFCPSVCYSKVALGGNAFDARWRQVLDLEFYVRILTGGGKLVGIPERLYRYRRHDQNQTAALTASLTRFTEEFALHREVGREAASRGWTSAARIAFKAAIVKRHILFLTMTDVLSLRFGAARAKLSFLRQSGANGGS